MSNNSITYNNTFKIHMNADDNIIGIIINRVKMV